MRLSRCEVREETRGFRTFRTCRIALTMSVDKVVNYIVRQGTVVGNLSIAFLSQSSLTRERHSHSSLTRASKGR